VIAVIPSTTTATTDVREEQQERRRNLAPVSRVTLSITPTPGVYASLAAASQSGFARSAAAPLAFVHRPWALERWRVPRGTTVLSSHTGFDETLTVGWNVMLAGRLGVSVGETGIGGRWDGDEGEGGMTDGVGKREEGRECLCLKGYKGDEERRIGLVGGFGFGASGNGSRKMQGMEAGEAREERGDEDVDGGVRLDAGDDLEEIQLAKRKAVSVSLLEMLARIEKEFANTGEVFEFSATSKSENSINEPESSQTNNHTSMPNPITTFAEPTSIETTNAPLETSRKPPKRQKKTPAPPPPPLPPSIPLTKAYATTLTPDKPITAIAIMNAFHPEEVERAVSAAYAGGWIDWQPIGFPETSKNVDQPPQAAAKVAPSSTESMAEETNDSTTTITAPLPSPAAPIAVQTGLPNPICHGNILMLTGAPRAPGIAHAQTHYGDKIVVVCVGHAACEEWSIRFLAEECRRQWPGLVVNEVFEEEVVVPKEKKEKKKVAEEVTEVS